MENLFGLPAHPLVVHAAVALVPLTVVGLLGVVLSSALRRRFAVLVAALAIASAVAVYFAQSSGEALEDRVRETELVEEHTESGERVLPWVIGLAVVAVGVATFDAALAKRAGDDPRHRRLGTGVLVVLALVAGAGATYSIVTVGHSGAKAVWNDTPDERP
jgi:hypothetical protein